MANPLTVTKLASKSHSAATDVRTPDKTRVEVVDLTGFTLGRFTFQQGWRWSECVKPVAKTERCQASHVGYAVSGTLVVQLEDGQEQTIHAGESYTVPPGHDAWVEGDQPFVGIEMMSADIYAKPAPATIPA